MKTPKTLGGCIDRLYDVRQEKADLNRQIKNLNEEITLLKDQLINNLPKSDADGVVGRKAKGTITKKIVGSVTDWPKFYAYIRRTKSHHLMQKRLSIPAINELWDDGKKIPGVEPFTVIDISCTKKR